MNDGAKREYLGIEERRSRLLDAAAEVLIDEGVDAISLRSVAHRAGVAHRMVSYSFGTKTGLVAALLKREVSLNIERAWSGHLADVPLPSAIAAALQAFIDSVRSDPRRFECFSALTATARLTPELADAARAEADAERTQIDERLAEWELQGGVQMVDRPAVAAAVQAAATGLAAWWLATRDDARVPAVVAMLAAGLPAEHQGGADDGNRTRAISLGS